MFITNCQIRLAWGISGHLRYSKFPLCKGKLWRATNPSWRRADSHLFDTKWTRLLLLPTQRNSNRIVTLARRVFPVTSGSFRMFNRNGDHGAKVMRNDSNTASKAVEMSAVR